jgi:hypothetical protein
MRYVKQLTHLFETPLSAFRGPGKLLTLVILSIPWSLTQAHTSREVRPSWNPVRDSRVAHHEIDYGRARSRYGKAVTTTTTATSVTGLSTGSTDFFAVRPCTSAGYNSGGFSNALRRPPLSGAVHWARNNLSLQSREGCGPGFCRKAQISGLLMPASLSI